MYLFLPLPLVYPLPHAEMSGFFHHLLCLRSPPSCPHLWEEHGAFCGPPAHRAVAETLSCFWTRSPHSQSSSVITHCGVDSVHLSVSRPVSPQEAGTQKSPQGRLGLLTGLCWHMCVRGCVSARTSVNR